MKVPASQGVNANGKTSGVSHVGASMGYCTVNIALHRKSKILMQTCDLTGTQPGASYTMLAAVPWADGDADMVKTMPGVMHIWQCHRDQCGNFAAVALQLFLASFCLSSASRAVPCDLHSPLLQFPLQTFAAVPCTPWCPTQESLSMLTLAQHSQ